MKSTLLSIFLTTLSLPTLGQMGSLPPSHIMQLQGATKYLAACEVGLRQYAGETERFLSALVKDNPDVLENQTPKTIAGHCDMDAF